jgi:hypothetical protein
VKIRFSNVLLTAVAAGFGLIALLGYLIADEPNLRALRVLLLGWASVLAALAVWIGALNLMRVHFRKMLDQTTGWAYSLFVVLGFALAFVAAVIPSVLSTASPLGGQLVRFNDLFFQHVLSASGAALSALLVFFLVFAGYRVLRRKPNVISITFVIFVVLGLMAISPTLVGIPDFGMRDVLTTLVQLPALAGARGLLIGIALGIIATGLRLLMAMDRPYGD